MDIRTHHASVDHGSPVRTGWPLDASRAISLRPVEASRLHVLDGRVWVTLNAPQVAHGLGDHVLTAGQTLDVPAGAHLVMEPWVRGAAARFDWCVVPALPAAVRGGRFTREVAGPWREFAQATGQAALAFARLLRGLLGYADHLVAGRGRVLSRWESNPP